MLQNFKAQKMNVIDPYKRRLQQQAQINGIEVVAHAAVLKSASETIRDCALVHID